MKCSRCGSENDDDFYIDKSAPRRRSWLCKKCILFCAKSRYGQIKKWAVVLKGGKCERCGYDRNIAALDFHHVDVKDMSISGLIKKFGAKGLVEELKKCVLLCANCHREEHSTKGFEWKNWETESFSNVKPRGSVAKKKHTCRQCGNVFQRKGRGVFDLPKYCSLECSSIAQRKVNRPTKTELLTMLQTKTQTQIAQSFGVSDVTVSKWRKRYGFKLNGEVTESG